MGLDMYLSKETYVKNWSNRLPQWGVTVTRGGQPTAIKPERITRIIEEVAYWRKANAIHAWFVDNVQDGVDECQRSYVPREKLKALLALVSSLLSGERSPEDALPTRGGFFFGSTDYDDWYTKDLEYTKATLEAVLAEGDDGDFYYQSSW